MTSVRIPESLIPAIEELVASYAAKASCSAQKPPASVIDIPWPTHDSPVSVLEPAKALDVIRGLADANQRVDVVHLDPVYEANNPAGRKKYARKTTDLIHAATAICDHILVWGHAPALGLLVDRWPKEWRLAGWLSWHFPNSPTRSTGWRSAHNSCIHLVSQNATLHSENYYTDEQKLLAKQGRLKFKPSPPNVVLSPMIAGFALRSQNVGFKGGQKPIAVVEHVLKMCLPASGGIILDPTAGAGTSGIAAMNLGSKAILCDRSPTALRLIRKRLKSHLDGIISHAGKPGL